AWGMFQSPDAQKGRRPTPVSHTRTGTSRRARSPWALDRLYPPRPREAEAGSPGLDCPRLGGRLTAFAISAAVGSSRGWWGPHVERGFWMKIAEGLSSEEAAIACGVSGPVGVRWFRERGGMPSIQLTPLSGRYLSFAEREDIALLRGQGLAVRAIARTLGRFPSTISRELRRNAATRGGQRDYRASTAHDTA